MNCSDRSVGPGGAEGSGKGGIKQERRTCGRVDVESSWSRLLGGKGKFGRISKATGFMSAVTVAQRSERPGGCTTTHWNGVGIQSQARTSIDEAVG